MYPHAHADWKTETTLKNHGKITHYNVTNGQMTLTVVKLDNATGQLIFGVPEKGATSNMPVQERIDLCDAIARVTLEATAGARRCYAQCIQKMDEQEMARRNQNPDDRAAVLDERLHSGIRGS